MNRQILLVRRPEGAASADDFRLVEAPIPEPAEGEVLVRHHFLSLDPYMRGRMNEGRSAVAPHPLGQVMLGATAGEVVVSRAPGFAVGDAVVGAGGWQEYSLVGAAALAALRKVDTREFRLSQHLGVLGSPGITAWLGLNRICRPSAGQTLVVSAASGAVGSAVAALAHARGCRTVGIAGGPAKCAYARDELGYQACIDHRAHADTEALSAALAEACPDGIAADFENVGGRVLDAVLPRMRMHGRIAICGLIAGYDGAPIPLSAPHWILQSRLTLQGFSIGDHPDVRAEALVELAALVRAGRLHPRESIVEGLAAAPEALLGLLRGHNLGKQLVRLA